MQNSGQSTENLLSINPDIISVKVAEQFHSHVNTFLKNLIIMKNVEENFFEHGGSILQRSLARTALTPNFEFDMKETPNGS